MDIKEYTTNLLGERLITYFDSQKLVNWAVEMMKNGYESENIIILAGLDSDTTEEKERYFWKSIEDLNLKIDKSDFELIDNYANLIARKVVEGEINPVKGLEIMQEIIRASDYNSKYMSFYELDEDLSSLNFNGRTIFNIELNKSNSESFILKEFELFLIIENLGIHEKYKEKAYCLKCKSVITPILKAQFHFKILKRVNFWRCGNCGSKNLIFYGSQQGKEKFIEIENNTP